MDPTQQLLGDLLGGEKLTPSRLDELLSTRVDETQYLEYKSGDFLGEGGEGKKGKKERAARLRRLVSGFANADGGVLLIGAVERKENAAGDTWTVDGCDESLVGSPLQDWARDALRDLHTFLIPEPRIHTLDHANGVVLVIAVDRAPRLVPCYEEGRRVHYRRFGHGTERIADDLYADLVLGRRQHPVLKLDRRVQIRSANDRVLLDAEWVLENDGITWANDVILGCIGYDSDSDPSTPSPPKVMSRHLEHGPCHRFDDLATDHAPRPEPLSLWKASIGTLAPMTGDSLRTQLTVMHAPRARTPQRATIKFRWSGALFVLTTSGPPIWYQVVIRGQARCDPDRGCEIASHKCTVTHAQYARPIVTLELCDPDTTKLTDRSS